MTSVAVISQYQRVLSLSSPITLVELVMSYHLLEIENKKLLPK